MSFLRDRKEKPFESKGRRYFEGLKQRADNLEKYAQDENEKPLNLSYNLYRTLLRLKELREVFFNNDAIIQPKSFLKEVNENDIRYAIREKALTIREVSILIETLEKLVIQIMRKTLSHLKILPLAYEEEFAKSDNEEYKTDLYGSTLNPFALNNCETYLSILTDSKEKSELLQSIQKLQNKFIVQPHPTLENVFEVELTDDEMSDNENDSGVMDHELLHNDDEEKKLNNLDKKAISPTQYSSTLNQSSSINLNDPLQWSQFPLKESEINPKMNEEKEFALPSQPIMKPVPSCTVWYKIGVLMATTVLSGVGGLVMSIFFTGGLALPVAVGVGACLGFIMGLKLIYSKEENQKNRIDASMFPSSTLSRR